MIGHSELLDIIATEAVEAIVAGQRKKPLTERKLPSVDYNLRFIRYQDGSLEWKDD